MFETHWLPGVLVLCAGLVAGVLFVLFSRRAPGAAPGAGTLDDLDATYRLYIQQLKELLADKHNLPAARFEEEKSRLELLAANTLKQKDELVRGVKHDAEKAKARAEKKEKQAAAAAAGSAMNPTLKGALIGGGVVGFFVLLGFLLTQESKPRIDPEQPRGPMAGNARGGEQQQEEPEDPRVTRAMKILETNPEDLDAITIVAHEMLVRQQFEDADKLTKRALGVDPFHVETRIHAAVLQAVHGDTTNALTDLQHLADTFPDSHEALIFAGMLSLQTGDKAKALANLERYAIEAPPAEQPPMLRQYIGQLRQEVGPAPK